MRYITAIIPIGLAVCSSMALAASSQSFKTYQVTDLKLVVNNSSSCATTYTSLKKWMSQPVSFQFSKDNTQADSYNVTDTSQQPQNHHYTIVSQKANGSVVDRVGMGSFNLNNQPIEYVVSIAADTSQTNFKYIYPVIIASNNAHCYFTALIHPDAATVASFKKHVNSGAAAAKTDLSMS